MHVEFWCWHCSCFGGRNLSYGPQAPHGIVGEITNTRPSILENLGDGPVLSTYRTSCAMPYLARLTSPHATRMKVVLRSRQIGAEVVLQVLWAGERLHHAALGPLNIASECSWLCQRIGYWLDMNWRLQKDTSTKNNVEWFVNKLGIYQERVGVAFLGQAKHEVVMARLLNYTRMHIHRLLVCIMQLQ